MKKNGKNDKFKMLLKFENKVDNEKFGKKLKLRQKFKIWKKNLKFGQKLRTSTCN